MAKRIPNSRVFDSQVIAPPPNSNSSVETGRKVCSFSPQRRFQQSGSGRTRKRRKKTDTISDVRDRKRPKKVVDRISCLPDDVLSHILSFLPTKQAMATSVVSKRWQSLWMLVPRLESTLYWPREAESFSRFVCDRVLPLQKSFDALTIRGFLFSSVGSWFWDFIACCSRELDLLELGGGVSLGLPSSLYTSKTLVPLKLRCKTFSVVFPIHLPCLKIFHLVSCVIDDGKSISGFISGCPVLEGVCLNIISLKPMDIPPILLTSQTLVLLKLAYCISFDISSSIYLRCLKALHLVHVRNLTEKSIGQFLAGCPVLEDLFIEFGDGDEPTKLPSNLFTCETLLSLTLSGPFPFHVPSTFCLPRLKIF